VSADLVELARIVGAWIVLGVVVMIARGGVD
jgi:hypothetical protein